MRQKKIICYKEKRPSQQMHVSCKPLLAYKDRRCCDESLFNEWRDLCEDAERRGAGAEDKPGSVQQD